MNKTFLVRFTFSSTALILDSSMKRISLKFQLVYNSNGNFLDGKEKRLRGKGKPPLRAGAPVS